MSTGELSGSNHNQARIHAEQLVSTYEAALQEAAQVAYPGVNLENTQLTEVFPVPTQPRDQAPDPGWDEAQEQEVRRIAGEFGFGREADKPISALGEHFKGSVAVISGGQPHKIKTEIDMVLADTDAEVNTIVLAGSEKRKLTTAAEQESATRLLGFVPEDEYTVARALAQQMPGFEAVAIEETLALSYDVTNGFAGGTEQSGQFVRIGHVGRSDVILFRVDREDMEGGKYRNQPGSGDIMKIMSGALTQSGDTATPIVWVDSATYQLSREAESVRAGLQDPNNRPVGVATYGTARLAAVKGETIPQPPKRNQIPGELHVAAESVNKLKEVLAA